MPVDFARIAEIVGPENLLRDSELLDQRYCVPNVGIACEPPMAAAFPSNLKMILELMNYFRTIDDINILIISSNTSPRFLHDTVPTKHTLVLDLSKMKGIPFIDKRNKVCVVEPGVTWAELIAPLEAHGLRPRAPFLPRKGKSALASVLEREPHLCPKTAFDISDPLLCMEVVFGNGDVFRTGEAAGPQSLEENRRAGAALKNPLGPGQTDIFRLIQGSKGTYGAVSWISMQCDFIPTTRSVQLVNHDSLAPLTEFIYATVRRRLVDEIFILNDSLFQAIFPSASGTLQKNILIYAINGYDWFPEEKVSYQTDDSNELLSSLGLEAVDTLAGIDQSHLTPILDGHSIDPHPKYSDKSIAVEIFYVTTLDRVASHVQAVTEVLEQANFPVDRMQLYVQPVIQARATHLEFSLIADKPSSSRDSATSYHNVELIGRKIARYAVSHGGFFSRPYRLVSEVAFQGHDVYMDGLRKIKNIFDPNAILNRGELCF